MNVSHQLQNGAVLEFLELSWTKTGRLFCDVVGYAPDGGFLTNSKCELSDARSRHKVALDLASRNGSKADVWSDALLSAYVTLNNEHDQGGERLALESLETEPEPGPLEFVWDPFLPMGFPANIYGDGGASKSTTVMGLAVAITQGMPFLGMPTKQGPVFYLDWELDKPAFLRRLYAICRGMGLAAPPRDLHYARLTEPLGRHLDSIIKACQQLDPVLVVVDSLGPAAGADPNDAEAFIKIVQDLRRLERCCAAVDHQSKGSGQSYRTKRAIGSGYKDFLVRGGVQVELAASAPGRASVVARHSKHTFTYEHEPIAYHIRYGIGVISFELADSGDVEFADADTLPLPLRVHKVLLETVQPIEAADLQEAVGAKAPGSLKNAITKLKQRGVQVRTTEVGTGGRSRKVYYSLSQPSPQESSTVTESDK